MLSQKNVRFHAHNVYLADVGLCGRQFKVRDTSYKYIRRGGYAMPYICDVITIDREGDFTSLDIWYCVS